MGPGRDHLLHATRTLLERTARTSGDEFFRNLAVGLAESLGMKYGLVGVLEPGGSRAARDGHEAVRLFGQHARRISAVVLDLTMPGMSGAEVLEGIRTLEPEVHVLLSSGYEPETLEQMLAAEHVSFLRKPWSPAELVSALRSAGVGRRA